MRWSNPCAECRHRSEHECEVGTIETPPRSNIRTFSTCGRTGWSLDYERSKSGACGPRGSRFEAREEGATT